VTLLTQWHLQLQEISGRLAEMPADAGYEVRVDCWLSCFRVRSSRVQCDGNPSSENPLQLLVLLHHPVVTGFRRSLSVPASPGVRRVEMLPSVPAYPGVRRSGTSLVGMASLSPVVLNIVGKASLSPVVPNIRFLGKASQSPVVPLLGKASHSPVVPIKKRRLFYSPDKLAKSSAVPSSAHHTVGVGAEASIGIVWRDLGGKRLEHASVCPSGLHFNGVTTAELFRDMVHKVAMMVD
jgi:hypothetical protein